jgi:PAS domain S-box-containing protein
VSPRVCVRLMHTSRAAVALLNRASLPGGERESWLARTSGEHAVIPDSPAAEPYHRLARLATRALRAPVALVTLLDGEREQVAACIGIDRHGTAELDLPCDFVIDDCGVERVDCIVFGDPLKRAHSLSSWRNHARRARAYVRVPLIGNKDDVVGSLCVVDYVARRWDDEDVSCLLDLADTAMTDAACRLRESEERYQRLIGLSHDAILVHAHGRVVFANSAAASLLGVSSPAALEHRLILDLVHPLDRDAVKKRTRYVLANHAPSVRTEFRFLRADGSVVAAEVSGTCIPYRGSDAVLVVCRDVSAQHASDLLLHMTEAQIQAIFSASANGIAVVSEPHDVVSAVVASSPDFVGICDPDGCVQYLNPAARHMIGLGPDVSLQHMRADAFYPSWALERLDAVAFPTALIAGSWAGDSALICGDGTTVPVWQTLIAHRTASGELTMFSTVMRVA